MGHRAERLQGQGQTLGPLSRLQPHSTTGVLGTQQPFYYESGHQLWARQLQPPSQPHPKGGKTVPDEHSNKILYFVYSRVSSSAFLLLLSRPF